MKDDKTITYRFLPQLFLRAPYYSYSGYDLSRLPEVLQEQAFRNAVWLASPAFYQLLEQKAFDNKQLKEKEIHTLNKYYNRMCFRPTPFGSFASFTLLQWGKGEQLKLAANDKARLHLLPDQQLLHERNSERNVLTTGGNLIVNPTLYRFADVFRYAKTTIDDKGHYQFSLQSIAAVKFNIRLFSLIDNRRVPVTEITKWIMQHGECSAEDAVDYIRFLLEAQAVYSDAWGHIISGQSANDEDALNGWDNIWKGCRSSSIEENIDLGATAKQVKGFTTFNLTGQPFYAALERPAMDGGPRISAQAELLKAVRLLQLLSVYEEPEDLTRFIREFRERFDREKVPLLIALDPDAGLSYSNLDAAGQNSGILKDLLFPEADPEKKKLGWNAAQQLLFKLWIGDKLRDPWSPLHIGENDIRQLEERTTKDLLPPQTQALIYRDTGEHLIIESAGGPTGASLIGRFSVFSDHVHACCREMADLEVNANPGVVFADIGQLSDTHVDNINRRLPVYPYEIPLNVFPVQPEANLIRPDDLTLSLHGNELILESGRLQKRVIPRLATAYNFRKNALPVFRLLCDLQFHGIKAGLAFDLENFFPGLSYYPRVSCGRMILSLGKWIVNEAQLAMLTVKEPEKALQALQAFREEQHIPRYISMGTHDQQLVFDLANINESKFFLQSLNGLKKITVTEYLMPDRSVIAGKKPLAGQMIAFLSHDTNIYKPINRVKKKAGVVKLRSFFMGSSWLYVKIFCIPRAADTILAEVILPFVAGNKKLINKWFFVRYSEKGYHLRLRIQAKESDLGTLLVALRKRMEAGGREKLIRDYQGGTYQREIERYGPRLIPVVEDIFRAGSDLTAWVLKERLAEKTVWPEFELGLLTADRMICSFLPATESRMAYLNGITQNFLAEFKADKQLKTGMDAKYRNVKTTVHTLLNSKIKVKPFLLLMKEIANLHALTANYLPEKKAALLADLVHMQLNRTFTTQQRQQEMLVYYCLQKYTLSLIARAKPFG